MVFVNMGVLAALSGLIFAARLNAATPKAGNLFELDAIAPASSAVLQLTAESVRSAGPSSAALSWGS